MPNAFAFGNVFTGYYVVITEEALKLLSKEESKAVIAHEIAHIKHRDIEIMTFAVTCVYFIYLLLRFSYHGMLVRGRSRSRDSYGDFLIGFFFLLFYAFSLIILALVSRTRERLADNYAKNAVGGRYLALALAKISTAINRRLMNNYEPLSALYFYSDILDCYIGKNARDITYDDLLLLKSARITFPMRLIKLYSTHPLTIERIKYLLD